MHKNGDSEGLLPLSALDIRASIHLRGQLPASLTRESTPKKGCQGTGIKPRTTAKLQHFGTGRWLSRRPKRTNDSPGIVAKNFFAAKSINPGSSLKQVISSLARVNRLWFRNRDCCS